MTIKQLKVGDYFKLKSNGRVYVRGKFERISKRYSYCDFNDVCSEHFAKGDREVITDRGESPFQGCKAYNCLFYNAKPQ